MEALRFINTSGRSAAWLARSVRDAEVGSSNLLAPTIFLDRFSATSIYVSSFVINFKDGFIQSQFKR